MERMEMQAFGGLKMISIIPYYISTITEKLD